MRVLISLAVVLLGVVSISCNTAETYHVVGDYYVGDHELGLMLFYRNDGSQGHACIIPETITAIAHNDKFILVEQDRHIYYIVTVCKPNTMFASDSVSKGLDSASFRSEKERLGLTNLQLGPVSNL